MKLIDKKALATDVVSHDVSPMTVNTDARAYGRLGWIVVLVGFIGFMVWAFLAPLDKGVPMQGTVAKESNRKSVQNMAAGTIEDILVKEGDTVKQGQVLVRMNGVQATSQSEISRTQYINLRTSEARLVAERDNKDKVEFPASLEPLKTDPRVQSNFALQTQLFGSRRSALQSELSALDENIAGIKMQLTGTEASRDAKQQQIAILKEQLESMRDLSKEGYVARNRLLELERTYVQLQGSIAEDTGTIGRARRQVAELNLKRTQRVQEYQREVRTQLADVQREAEAAANRVKATEFEVQGIEIKSPADGVVLGMAVFTRGGVVPAGFRMMDVVPTADRLVVEGKLPITLVDKVHPGLQVDLTFPAFNQAQTPQIPGEVTTVSADRLVDEKTGEPYYKVLAKVSPEGQKTINSHQLQVRPGMPVSLFVKTGERTMMSYLLKPLFDRAKSALAEE